MDPDRPIQGHGMPEPRMPTGRIQKLLGHEPASPPDAPLTPSVPLGPLAPTSPTVGRPATEESRSFDGTGNNLAHPSYGAAHTALLPLAGDPAPRTGEQPTAREVSTTLFQDTERPDARGMSQFTVWLAQFITSHEMALTPSVEDRPELLPVPDDDPHFGDARGIVFRRSDRLDDGGIANAITSFIDGSAVYGSSPERAAALREGRGGRLWVDENRLPVTMGELRERDSDTEFSMGRDQARPGSAEDDLRIAGDVRANENVGLFAMHTLFVRAHNAEAAALQDALREVGSPLAGNDDYLFEQARRRTVAMMQKITYYELAPALFGENAVSPYPGYDPEVNAGIANAFSTAANRFHPSVPGTMPLADAHGDPLGGIELEDATFDPTLISAENLERMVRGAVAHPMNSIEPQAVSALTTGLFEVQGQELGIDLIATNVARGRDHGLPSFNDLREAYGLAPIASFEQLVGVDSAQDEAESARLTERARQLNELYGDIANLDAWIGMVSERHELGSSFGETQRTVFMEQLERLRSGDRFWFENTDENGLAPAWVDRMRRQPSTLAELLSDHMGVEVDHAHPFFADRTR